MESRATGVGSQPSQAPNRRSPCLRQRPPTACRRPESGVWLAQEARTLRGRRSVRASVWWEARLAKTANLRMAVFGVRRRSADPLSRLRVTVVGGFEELEIPSSLSASSSLAHDSEVAPCAFESSRCDPVSLPGVDDFVRRQGVARRPPLDSGGHSYLGPLPSPGGGAIRQVSNGPGKSRSNPLTIRQPPTDPGSGTVFLISLLFEQALGSPSSRARREFASESVRNLRVVGKGRRLPSVLPGRRLRVEFRKPRCAFGESRLEKEQHGIRELAHQAPLCGEPSSR